MTGVANAGSIRDDVSVTRFLFLSSSFLFQTRKHERTQCTPVHWHVFAILAPRALRSTRSFQSGWTILVTRKGLSEISLFGKELLVFKRGVERRNSRRNRKLVLALLQFKVRRRFCINCKMKGNHGMKKSSSKKSEENSPSPRANHSVAAMLFRMQMRPCCEGGESESTLPFLRRANPVLCYAAEGRVLFFSWIDWLGVSRLVVLMRCNARTWKSRRQLAGLLSPVCLRRR